MAIVVCEDTKKEKEEREEEGEVKWLRQNVFVCSISNVHLCIYTAIYRLYLTIFYLRFLS